MKAQSILRPIFVFFILFTVEMSAQQRDKTHAKAVIQTTIYCDHCRQCETCGQTFQTNITRIKGVRMFELNEKDMTITVFYNPQKTDLPTIRKHIADLGYDADEVKADIAAYEKLDGCCKKT